MRAISGGDDDDTIDYSYLAATTKLTVTLDNDGNGTIYLTKCNGGFSSMNIAELSRMQHLEDTKNAPKKRGYSRD